MQFSLRLSTQPHPGVWPRVLVTIIIIVILAAAGWAACGPPGVIIALTGGGVLAPVARLASIGQPAQRGAVARGGAR